MWNFDTWDMMMIWKVIIVDSLCLLEEVEMPFAHFADSAV